MIFRSVIRYVIFLFFLYALPISDIEAKQRPYRITDQFEREEIGAVTFAPDGRAVAFTRRRPANSQLTTGMVIDETRDDIWVQNAPGEPVRNLTNGATDGTGWWNPQWSPDGQYLAFLSSRGGTVTLWAWERVTGSVRQLSTHGVDFASKPAYRWIDGSSLLLLARPEGESATPARHGLAAAEITEQAEAAWAKARRGEVTASDIDSLEFRLPRRRLVRVHVTDGKTQVIADAQIDTADVNWWLSPNGKTVAFMQPGPVEFAIQRVYMGGLASIELRTVSGQPVSLDQPLPNNVVTTTLRWSSDGKELAFFALDDKVVHSELLHFNGSAREVRWPAVASKEYPGLLYRVNITTGRVEQVDTGDIDLGRASRPPDFKWLVSGELLFHAPQRSKRPAPDVLADAEWLVLERGGQTREALTAKNVPDSLEATEDGAALLGISSGDVWRIDPVEGEAKNLTISLPGKVVKISLTASDKGKTFIIASAGDPRSDADRFAVRYGLNVSKFTRDYLLDPNSGEVVPLAEPTSGADLVAFASDGRSTAYTVDSRNGTLLWRSSTTGNAELLVSTNSWLKNIAKPKETIIEYTSLNGDRLKTKCTLPYGYRSGRRYPLVVDSDTNYLPSTTPTKFELSDPDVLDFWPMFPIAGYTYCFVSMPTLETMDQVGRMNLLNFTDGIMPAVDKAIESGFADPERVFLFGGSSMGNAVYALVTQTARFKAAVAVAGWVDQVSGSDRIYHLRRYTDSPFDMTSIGAGPYSNLVTPFWRNGDHLRRNSALQYVDRVQTPLMMIHGDLDSLAITEPESFFKALVAQRKPARFVRYWGEGHINMNPKNFADQYQRIFAWFDQWGDISRDKDGNIIFEGERVKSRNGAPPLKPENYAEFEFFGPGGAAGSRP